MPKQPRDEFLERVFYEETRADLEKQKRLRALKQKFEKDESTQGHNAGLYTTLSAPPPDALASKVRANHNHHGATTTSTSTSTSTQHHHATHPPTHPPPQLQANSAATATTTTAAAATAVATTAATPTKKWATTPHDAHAQAERAKRPIKIWGQFTAMLKPKESGDGADGKLSSRDVEQKSIWKWHEARHFLGKIRRAQRPRGGMDNIQVGVGCGWVLAACVRACVRVCVRVCVCACVRVCACA